MKKKIAAACAALGLAAALFAFAGCSSPAPLTDYISEYRSNLWSGTQGDYSVFATYSTREYPYLSDGNVGDMTTLFEVTLAAADNTKTYEVSFTCGGTDYTAQLSYDSVRMVHRWSQSMEEPTEGEIAFTVRDADDAESESVTVTATTLRGGNVLSPADLLDSVSARTEQFDALRTENGGFAGEIYIRLLASEEGCLYYIGIIDRSGNTYAILADAETGEILAAHEG